MAARRYHRKERPQGARGKPFRLRSVEPGSKKKLSSDEIALLVKFGAVKPDARKTLETPFGGMSDAMLKVIAGPISKNWGKNTKEWQRLFPEERKALESVWSRLYSAWLKRHPDTNPMEFR
jgi:hypothetical protein